MLVTLEMMVCLEDRIPGTATPPACEESAPKKEYEELIIHALNSARDVKAFQAALMTALVLEISLESLQMTIDQTALRLAQELNLDVRSIMEADIAPELRKLLEEM